VIPTILNGHSYYCALCGTSHYPSVATPTISSVAIATVLCGNSRHSVTTPIVLCDNPQVQTPTSQCGNSTTLCGDSHYALWQLPLPAWQLPLTFTYTWLCGNSYYSLWQLTLTSVATHTTLCGKSDYSFWQLTLLWEKFTTVCSNYHLTLHQCI
jgi:hypothetical protein